MPGTKIWQLLVVIFVLGAILIFFSEYFRPAWNFGLMHELGIAFVVASVLGATIEITLVTKLSRDVFEATLGYILLPDFRNEVARITGYKFLCEHHFLLIEVTLWSAHVVEVTTSIERRGRNITAYPEKLFAYLYIDDWGFADGLSRILECRLIANNRHFEGHKVTAEASSRVKWQSDEAEIGPSGTFTMLSKYTEYRRDNDVVYYFFGMPTKNPEIEVRLPPELDYSISFGGADPAIERSQYADGSQSNGMYFPHQAMSVRWWPKAPAA